jgi:hypothetical protein
MKRASMRRRAPLRAKTKLRRSKPLQRTASMAATERQHAAVAGRTCIVCRTDRRTTARFVAPRVSRRSLTDMAAWHQKRPCGRRRPRGRSYHAEAGAVSEVVLPLVVGSERLARLDRDGCSARGGRASGMLVFARNHLDGHQLLPADLNVGGSL